LSIRGNVNGSIHATCSRATLNCRAAKRATGDFRDGQDRPLDPNRGDLRHLRDSGLVESIPESAKTVWTEN